MIPRRSMGSDSGIALRRKTMSLHIAIVQEFGQTYLTFILDNDVSSKDAAQDHFGGPDSDIIVLDVHQFEIESENDDLLAAMVLTRYDHCIGHDVENLVNFGFELGRKFAR